jgi:hypothetical protein
LKLASQGSNGAVLRQFACAHAAVGVPTSSIAIAAQADRVVGFALVPIGTPLAPGPAALFVSPRFAGGTSCSRNGNSPILMDRSVQTVDATLQNMAHGPVVHRRRIFDNIMTPRS